MDLGLHGCVALVTGSSSGIGAATARLLAEEGADVVVAFGHNEAGARQTATLIEAFGRRAWLCGFDIADAAAVAAAIRAVGEQTGGFDVLVICAGHNIVTPFADVTPDEWDTVISVNLNGAFYTLRAAMPFLRDGAAVVTVASVAAATGAPHHAHYAAAKAGLVNLTKRKAQRGRWRRGSASTVSLRVSPSRQWDVKPSPTCPPIMPAKNWRCNATRNRKKSRAASSFLPARLPVL